MGRPHFDSPAHFRSSRARPPRSRGQALVELALVAPIVLILLGGAIDLGRLFYSQITISDAAREGALWAAQHPNSWVQGCDADRPVGPTNENQVTCHARNEATGGFISIASTDVTCSATPAPTVTGCVQDSPAPGSSVYVSVRGRFTTIMGGLAFNLGTTAVGRVVKLPPPAAAVAQTITFNPIPDKELGIGSFTTMATASSGLAVTFVTTTPGVCGSGGATGSTISVFAIGACTVVANQAGDARWAAATPVPQTFHVTTPPPPPPGGQTISFGPLPDRQLGSGSPTVSATATSGVPVTFTTTTPRVCTSAGTNGSTITLIQTGSCTVQADQAGDGTWTPAPPVLQTFNVTAPTPPCTAPTPTFTVTPASGTAFKNAGHPGTTFTFNANASTVDAACHPVWSWNFGNTSGTSSTPFQTTYVYPAAAPLPNRLFTVTLVVTVDGGLSSTTTRTVRVDPG